MTEPAILERAVRSSFTPFEVLWMRSRPLSVETFAYDKADLIKRRYKYFRCYLDNQMMAMG